MSILSPLQADCIIFDVDGVLIDTRDSFPNVIKTAIHRIWTSVLGRQAEESPFSIRHFETAKQYPSFNDDYDICWALTTMAASRKDEDLDRCFPSPWQWEESILAMEASDLDMVPWFTKNFGDGVPYDETRSICQEIYFGSDKTQDLLGRTPINQDEPGLWLRESSLLKKHWNSFSLPVGIYTGRSREELALALEILQWEDLPQEQTICWDDGIRKPSPQGLQELCLHMETTWPLFFGDTASDRKSLLALGKGDFVAIGRLIKNTEFRFPNIQDALRALGL